MSNANRDYAIVYDVKNSSLVLSRPLNFYITDKNTSNIFVRLVTKVNIGNGVDQYTDIEEASNYVLTMRVIKPNNEVKSLEATQHEEESIFQFDLTEDFKDIPGKYICELTISTIVSGRQELITSDPFNYEVKRSILSNVGEIIETKDTTVEKLLNDLETTKTELSSQIKEKANKLEVKNKYYDVSQPLRTFNKLPNMEFKRKHARNLFKNLQYKISCMDFLRDFLDNKNGNMYPQIESNGTTLTESVKNNRYIVTNNNESGGSQTRRLIGGFNMFSSYDFEVENIIKTSSLGVRCGIDIINAKDNDRYCIFVAFTNDNKLEIRSEIFLNGVSQGVITEYSERDYNNNFAKIIFTVRANYVDVYKVISGFKTHIATVNIGKNINTFELMNRCRVALFTRLNAGESVTYKTVSNYFDSGISQGDIKPIKYKNGAPIIKDGRIYFTMSSRFESGSYQTVISQNLSGCDYKLEGVIYYLVDNKIGQDLASSIVYDNDTGKFLIWNTCFNNDYHILSYGEAYCDIMHGINFVNMTLMDRYAENDTDFLGKYGDEDPDFFYNDKTRKWNLIICRLVYDNEARQDMYRYFLFESDNPFTGYVFKDKTLTGTNTGGSIVKVGGEYYLVCGSNYHTTSQYNIYNLSDLSTLKPLKKDYADGGFRGWGTVFAIPCGNFTKYGWITFDREQVGETKWSYGNIYYYESDLLNDGCEYNVKYSY